MGGNAVGGHPNTQWATTLTPSAGPVLVKQYQNPQVPGIPIGTLIAQGGSSYPQPGGGSLWSYKGTSAAAACWLMFFDAVAITAPITGALPLFEAIAIPIGSTTPVQFSDIFTRAKKFTTGLWWATSSTQGSYTASASTISLSVEYS